MEAIRRTSTRSGCVPPTGVNSWSSRALSTLAWVLRLMSPTSSRKSDTAVGAFEGAALLGRAAGLRAVAIAEEFRLDVRLGDGGAVQLDEDAVAAQALGMNGARDEFLAGAGFAVDEHAAVGRRHEANLLAQRLDGNAFAGEHRTPR